MKLKALINSKQLKFTAITLILIFLALSAINRTYFNFTRNALIQEQVGKMRIEATNINAAIKLSRKGERYVEELIGQNLRSVSLFAQSNLDPDIEKVSNESLDVISKKAGVDHITLMKRSGEDIIGYKSSDSKEIGMTTIGWRGDWFKAFNQLLDNKNVNVPSGQSLQNYWAGPINTSMTNTDNIDKWGYYHDGSTNYIIDPYVHDTTFVKYQKETGVDAMIKEIVDNDVVAREVTVFNPPTFLKEQEQFKKNGVVWYSDREVLFGTYNNKDQKDMEFVKTAYSSNKPTSFETTIDGKSMLKTFIPLQLEYPVVIGLVSDLTPINAYLDTLLKKLRFVITMVTLVAMVLIHFIIRYYSRNKEKAAQFVQDLYVDNIDQLFTSVKEQRHDFNNQISTIQSMVLKGEYAELQKFTNEMVGEASELNDIININSPALCALIQAKITQAMDRKIAFEYELIKMGDLSLGVLKSTDLVKIISNLIDNAFDAVEMYDDADRIVKLTGYVNGQQLHFSVFSKGNPIPDEQLDLLFKKGFSTKLSTGKNSGYGLFIVEKIIKKYNGRITVNPQSEGNTFNVAIPI
jgi:hypothetical protein